MSDSPINTADVTDTKIHNDNARGTSIANKLNRDCFCTTLNSQNLDAILRQDTLNQDVLATHPQLFSNTTAFISPTQLQQMLAIIQAVGNVVNLPMYVEQALKRATGIAAYNPGTKGVFMGYDFHLSETGPKVIEINTNAGGAFLNAALVSAQTKCCRDAGVLLPKLKSSFEEQFVAMFLNEWKIQRGNKPLTTIAIVDEDPKQQFLYPEFKMAQRLFERHGINAIIAGPDEFKIINNVLCSQGKTVDLVYNRLTDFSLADTHNSAIRQAYEEGSVVLTPNPRQHALYADKRNLGVLSDSLRLKNMGATDSDIAVLQAGIPKTQNVTAENATDLWAERKQLFFKPAAGFGSRATYRGGKMTKRVWSEILQTDYVAQQLVKPSERGILIDERETALKMDIRAYVYAGEIQLLAARLYQGQTTNFRTQGGGFAPVFVVGDA
jgi:hypothetical protein